MVGRIVSHYRIVGHLASGGMGVVYKLENARRRGVSHHAALSNSWLLSSLRDDPRFQELLQRMKEQCERFEV